MDHALIFNVNDHVQSGRSNGAYRISHVLREVGWDIEVIDWALLWTADELKALVASRMTPRTRFFGFSHMFSSWSETLNDFCRWVRDRYPAVTLISGSNVLPSFETHLMDYYIHGFGEVAIVKLLSYLYDAGPRPQFDAVRINGSRVIAANTHYPAYPVDSLRVTYQRRDFIEPNEWLSIEFARGCKFSCAFCNFPVLGVKGDHSRSQQDLELHLKQAFDEHGVENYYVMDETFNDSTQKITKFADVIERLDFVPYFSGFARADLLISRPADREEMRRMNFLGHFYGIESLNHSTGKLVGKGMHPDRIKSGLLELKDYYQQHAPGRYNGTVSMIIGLPHETIDSITNAHRWMLENWQGQHCTWIPFEIVVGERDKKSTLSQDYEKYGYEVIPNTVATYHTEAVKLGKAIKWRNPHMDYYDSWRLARQFGGEAAQHDLRLPCFHLGFLSPKMLTLNERLATHMREFGAIKADAIQVVNAYKIRKLNWS